MKITLLFLVAACCWGLFTSGCVPKEMYYLGDYSETLYAFERDRNQESLLRHRQELQTIVSESETRTLAVPPGIYAELGYIELKENKTKEAIRLFQSESALYPEAKPFMDRLIQAAQAREDSSSDAK